MKALKTIPFTKMSGAGNDFVLIDNRLYTIKNRPSAARRLCDRRWGVGADGLLLLEPSDKASYRMMYYNADGSYGGMCGNGGRCIARFAVDSHIAPPTHSFEALGHIYSATVNRRSVSLKMKDPSPPVLRIRLKKRNTLYTSHFIDTGSPHLVLFTHDFQNGTKNLSDVDVIQLGRWLRFHRRFSPNGVNVNFVQTEKPNRLRIRTYERGVENETLACGTGATAAALIAFLLHYVAKPVHILPRSNQELVVNFDSVNERFTNVTLSGPATVTFTGTITL